LRWVPPEERAAKAAPEATAATEAPPEPSYISGEVARVPATDRQSVTSWLAEPPAPPLNVG
ncbi:hypothetical protein, partial [Mycobacterium kansasii]